MTAQYFGFEQALFWCPPLQGKTQPLTYCWSKFANCLSNSDSQQLIELLQRPLASMEQERANSFLALWQQAGISRYNSYFPKLDLPEPYILVVTSPETEASLSAIVLRALAEASAQNIETVLVISDKDGGIQELPQKLRHSVPRNIKLISLSKPSHHASLIKQATAVYTFNSWLGFEAILWGKTVHVWGKPFYAGLGLTVDTLATAPSQHISLQQLVYFILLEHSVSFYPNSQHEVTLEQAVKWLALQNQQRWRFPATLYAVGFSRHWRSSVKAFLQGSELKFVRHFHQVPPSAAAVTWGRSNDAKASHIADLYRLEDGFLRSVGLGALFAKPLSWIADKQGLYFDATQPSDLELLLIQHQFSEAELQQAAELRHWLCANKISKYNTGSTQWQAPVTGKKIILVPGQVESDASIAFGAPGIKQNIQLLQAVRARNPDAFIIYKPHPDVLAGARAAGSNEQRAVDYCDNIAAKVDMSAMLDHVDEVHVLTSLAGFEALLRGKKVVCYGLPFYAGWGLTTDVERCSRRNRKLALDELVAGCLNLYPLYVDVQTGYYSNAIEVAKTLAKMRQSPKARTSLWHRMLRKCINLVRGTK